MGNFRPLEVVDRGSETQVQVIKNLKKINLAGYPHVCDCEHTYKIEF